MGRNGLAMTSYPVFPNTSSPMDPFDRVPPFDRALPDNQYSVSPGDGDDRRHENERSDDVGADEHAEMDPFAVDEMVRDLELELGGDSPDDNPLDQARKTSPGASTLDHPGVNEDDFATVGVRNLEWRLPIIRSAAHRSADAIASSQLADPSHSQEVLLTKIVLSTYRLIDPRYRGSYFQRVRVGRMLPIALQNASCIDGTPTSLQPTVFDDQRDSIRLFGHAIPMRANVPTAVHEVALNAPRRQVSKKNARRKRRQAPAKSNYRDEAVEVLAELRSGSNSSRWPGWLSGRRWVAALIGLAMLFMLALMTYPLSAPRQDSIATPKHLAGDEKTVPSNGRSLSSVDPAAPRLRPLPPVSSPVDAAAAARQAEVHPRETPADEPTQLIPPPQEQGDFSLEIAATLPFPDITHHELTTEALMAALAKASEVPDVDVPKINLPDAGNPSRRIPIATAANPPAANPSIQDLPNVVEDAEMTAPTLPIVPTSPSLDNTTPLDETVIAAAVSTLWTETESAARRFSDSTAAELIDSWEVIADVAGPGSAENAAAKRLIRQASWLIYPLSKIVAQLRQSDAPISTRFVNATDRQLHNTEDLRTDELEELLTSWRAARKRVVRTSDLNQLLRQGNVLLDRIVISDRLSPRDRGDFLAAFRTDVEKLAKICSDEDATTELKNLLAAIDMLPGPSEWARLESAEPPSGLMASIYCLQQRRWDQGIAWLGQTANLSVAAAAKSEWKLIQSEQQGSASVLTDAEARTVLANRWSKIADRLDPREAAAVRRHAIDLYGDAPETANQRDKLRALLPQYLE